MFYFIIEELLYMFWTCFKCKINIMRVLYTVRFVLYYLILLICNNMCDIS